jgi:hypothetical protein
MSSLSSRCILVQVRCERIDAQVEAAKLPAVPAYIWITGSVSVLVYLQAHAWRDGVSLCSTPPQSLAGRHGTCTRVLVFSCCHCCQRTFATFLMEDILPSSPPLSSAGSRLRTATSLPSPAGGLLAKDDVRRRVPRKASGVKYTLYTLFRSVLTTFRIQNNACVHRTYTPVYTNPTNSKIKTTPSSVQNNPGGSFLFNCEGNYQLMSFSRIFEKGYRPDKSNNLRSRSFSPQFA